MNAKWIVSLSNGETLDEAKNVGDVKRSPWLNLVDYVLSKNLEVRHVKIICNGIEYNSPTYNSSGRFSNVGNVSSFWVARRDTLTMGNQNPENSYIELSYSDNYLRHHLVIDVYSNQCWQSTSDLDKGVSLFISQYSGGKW